MSHHGAEHLGGGRTRFAVWAPERAAVVLLTDRGHEAALDPAGDGYHRTTVDGAPPGTRYRYLLDGEGPFADPASRWQPLGVHGPSAVDERRTPQLDGWRGVPTAGLVTCEIHVGTFSGSGTFAGVADALPHLAASGYTAIELMPVSEFPGDRNWGYDGVFPHAVQSSYGGPAGLAELVDRAHQAGIAVLVDVVCNHLGPEGGTQVAFGPYLTDRYRTPWGPAVNVDGPGSDAVRAYFVEAACRLVGELGVDGLRLDAVHEIVDTTASPFLAELNAALASLGKAQGRSVVVVAESPANDPRLTTPVSSGGLGCDASWDDDFHHCLRVATTGMRDRWFASFDGLEDLARTMRHGWALTGRHAAGFGRRHGAPLPERFGGERLVVFAQNHDQIGNAGHGERLASALPAEAQFAIGAVVLLAPFLPLRFMGEEYGEVAPFHYFTSHEDPELVAAVRAGRAGEVGGEVEAPDPQDRATFAACVPDRALAAAGHHRELLDWQRELLELRRTEPALGSLEPARTEATADGPSGSIAVVRTADPYLDAPAAAFVCRLAPSADAGGTPVTVAPAVLAGRRWRVRATRGTAFGPGQLLDARTGTPGLVLAPYAAVVLVEDGDGGGPPGATATPECAAR